MKTKLILMVLLGFQSTFVQADMKSWKIEDVETSSVRILQHDEDTGQFSMGVFSHGRLVSKTEGENLIYLDPKIDSVGPWDTDQFRIYYGDFGEDIFDICDSSCDKLIAKMNSVESLEASRSEGE